jgi:simple sugar transport system permease protein
VRPGVVIAILVLIITFIMLRYTKFGRSLYAVGGSAQSAAMMGLNVKLIKMKAYMLSSFLCSIGGICYCLNTMAGSVSQATGLEMDAISSAVIGGTLLTGGVGNVIGSFFGVLVLGLIQVLIMFQGNINSWWTRIIVGALVLVFIFMQNLITKISKKSKG